MMNVYCPVARALLMAAGLGASLASAQAARSPAPQSAMLEGQDPIRLPLVFEENLGQTDAQVDFVARGPGYGLWLTRGEAVLALGSGAVEQRRIARLRLHGAEQNPVAVGETLASGLSHYIDLQHGSVADGVRRFSRVRFDEVYPGIDIVYRSDAAQQLEFDFVLAPGAEPDRIRWQLDGADRTVLDEKGRLVLELGGPPLVLHRPIAFQQRGAVRVPVEVAYRLEGDQVGFAVGDYDPDLALVIDPVITYGSFLGGSNVDEALDLARDAVGNLYVSGSTWSLDFPVQNPIHGNLGGQEAFVSKIDATGSNLVFSTYLGGEGKQWAAAIEVDGLGRPFICGGTEPSGQSPNGFVLRLNANGSLGWSRIVNTEQWDECLDLALDDGKPVAVGFTFSHADFPRQNALSNWNVANGDAPFLLRYDADGNLLQSTLLPNHPDSNDAAHGVAVRDGYAYVTGVWAPGGGDRQAFVIKLDGDASFPESGEYLRSFGGSVADPNLPGQGAYDSGQAIVVDSTGRAFVAGVTYSTDFPVSGDAFDAGYSGGGDAFIARLSAVGNLIFASYLDAGWSVPVEEAPTRIAFDPVNSLYVVGRVSGGPFIAKLPNFGTQFGYLHDFRSFYLEVGAAHGIVLAGVGDPILAGAGASHRFAVTPGAVQTVHGGGSSDGYLMRIAERLPVITIQDASVGEGSGCVNLVVTTDAASLEDVRFDWTTSNGTAVSGQDYTHRSETLVGISPGVTVPNTNVSVCPINDNRDEPNETLTVSLSNVTGATVGRATATVTILDDDPTPVLSVDNGGCSVTEGDSGSTNCAFVFRLSSLSASAVTFNTATANGTATSGSDYTGHASTARGIPAGQNSLTVNVPVLGDALDEADETFSLNVSGVSGATPTSLSASGGITDDDAPPSLSINDRSITEGTGGSVSVTFTVGLSAPSGRTVSVNWGTANGSATAPADYGAGSGTLTFSPGQTSKTITRSIVTDALDEPNETFFVGLSAASNAAIADDQGRATINDDDAAPSLSADNGGCTVTEGNSGSANCTFVFRLSASSGQTVTFNTATANGSATAGSDYTGHASTARSIAAGQTTLNVTVPVLGDTLDEVNESFTLQAGSVVNATPSSLAATGTINDDDALPTLSVDGGGCSVTEGQSGSTNCTFVFRLSAVSGRAVTFNTATANGSATAGADYTGHAPTARSIAAGQATLNVSVPVLGDTLDEANETFTLQVSSVANASPSSLSATGTINDDDDVLPTLSVDGGGCSAAEGDSGSANCRFVFRLSAVSGQTVTFTTTTANGTAGAGSDYTGHGSTARTTAPGQATLNVSVPVLGDTLDEANETFTLQVSSVVNATPSSLSATGTIEDDDAPPNISIDDCSVLEGAAGTANCRFRVRLSAASGRTVSVNWAVARAAENALANGDFEAPQISGDFTTYGTSQTFGGWGVAQGAVDLVRQLWTSASGNQSLELNGDGPGMVATLYQNPGPSQLSFAYTANPGCGPGIKSFAILTASTEPLILDVDATGLDYTNMGWQWREVPGSSVSGDEALYLAGNNDGPCGAVVDDIVVVPADIASPPVDLAWSSGTATIAAGATQSALIDIPVRGDNLAEIDEHFAIVVTGGSNFGASSPGIGTIRSDDAPAGIFCSGFEEGACAR